jgi:hypothetical protein
VLAALVVPAGLVGLVVLVGGMARPPCRPGAATAGSTIRNIAVVRHIRTARQRTNMAARLEAIPWPIGRRMRDRIRVNRVDDNRPARRIVGMETDNSPAIEELEIDNSRVIEATVVGHKRARRTGEEEEQAEGEGPIEWATDKFLTLLADRIRAPSAELLAG